MADKVYQPAGQATEEQFASVPNPIGLYRNIYNGTEVGVIDPIQGDAVVRNGFELVEEGREAAMKSQDDMDADREKFLKKRDANPDDEIAKLQAQLDAANERLASKQAKQKEAGATEAVRAHGDKSDTSTEQSQLVPNENIKPGDPKAAEAAKKEANQPTSNATDDLKSAEKGSK